MRLVYQGYVDLAAGRISGVEALMRWRHPIRGELAPASFIPLAEATGLTREQLTQMALNSFEGSFLPDADKAARIAEVRAYAAAI